jgi:putative PIN family toxin of toxin-antitoxin system
LRVVLDTNVLISGLLSPHGAPGRIVDLVIAGELTLLVDDRVLSEYADVLRRPNFGFDTADIHALLVFLELESEQVLATRLKVGLPDGGDLPFLEVARSGHAESLVTGNVRHYPARARATLRVETPSFIKRYGRP